MEKRQVIEVKTCAGVKFIKCENIVFIRTAKRHTIITLTNNTTFEAFHSIKWFDQSLPKPDFCRCHNSYIIHCGYIESLDYTAGKILINGFGEISFSRKYKLIFLDKLKEFISLH